MNYTLQNDKILAIFISTFAVLPAVKDFCFSVGNSESAARHFYVEMMGFLGAGNNPMVGMTVSVAVAVEEASK